MIETPAERRASQIARHFKSLTELVSRMPRYFDEVVRLNPASREQIGWMALSIGKEIQYAPGAPVELVTAGNKLRLFALGLLGEPCGVPLPATECPLAARLAQI